MVSNPGNSLHHCKKNGAILIPSPTGLPPDTAILGFSISPPSRTMTSRYQHKTRIFPPQSISEKPVPRFASPSVMPPQIQKKAPMEMPQWQPGGNQKPSILQRLRDAMAVPAMAVQRETTVQLPRYSPLSGQVIQRSIPSLMQGINESRKKIDRDGILWTKVKKQAEQQYCSENTNFLEAIAKLRLEGWQPREITHLFDEYIATSSPQCINISYKVRKAIVDAVEEFDWDTAQTQIELAEKQIESLVEKDIASRIP